MLLRTRRTERGQGSLELVGIIVLASILVLATTGTIVQMSPQVRSEVSYRICQILNLAGGGECESPDEPRTPEDRLPDDPCVVDSQQGSVEVTGAFVVSVTVGKQLLVEELSDGTYRVTEVDLGKVGVGVGPGIDVSVTLDGKKYGAVAIATADALLAGQTGRSWDAKDQDEVNDILKGLIAEQVLDNVAPDLPGPKDVPGLNMIPGIGDIDGPPNPTRLLLEQIIGDLRDPDSTFVEGGLEGNAAASISGITAGAGGEANLGVYLGAKKTKDGYTVYYKGKVGASAFGTIGADDASAGASGEALFAINLDKDGKPESVSVTAGYTLAADQGDLTSNTDDQTYVETTAEVPLTGDALEDAQILAEMNSPLLFGNFLDRAKEDGTLTQNTYSQDPNTYGLGATGSWLGDYGGSIKGDFTTRDLEESTYWDGTTMADRPDC
jgi:hypothetical protein